LAAEGSSGVERLASLVGLLDFASVYLALGIGVDPTPVGPIDDLKARLADS
jgi:glucose/mannose-6-phosphate isomerase